MKKYFLSMVAVILIVAGSAFVKSKSNMPPTVYHWYNVNGLGAVVSGSDAFGGATETQAYADVNTPCPTSGSKDCIRGFISVPSFPTMAKGEATPLTKP